MHLVGLPYFDEAWLEKLPALTPTQSGTMSTIWCCAARKRRERNEFHTFLASSITGSTLPLPPTPRAILLLAGEQSRNIWLAAACARQSPAAGSDRIKLIMRCPRRPR